ncbi:carboxymuconolactone decarboxylase family protein [Alkaliphilus peptidifermentans]|uniref:Carboxymuconolactone decarboxylase family protein n=1 Tax=Alkaliphilus peptidifermentans DSM 18978 TaxID=1120976 RepID=A0A1G5EKJ6_9FIRM|nr:hypothetical protein [Alkaliphilus peptidifermentans]SCY27472.1 hypothetical protein SAMN03080606_01189 [Alkaliphilus peptidifermentans DSM 18978]
MEALLKGLNNPDIFTEREVAAIEFAERMSENQKITDELWLQMKKHFDDGEIVEISCLVGIFNYFNRFNNILDVDITT